MRIAIAVDPEGRVSGHLGRSERFMIADIDGRTVSWMPDVAVSGCGHHHHGHGEGDHDHQAHTHGALVEALSGCDLVFSAGAGRRVINDLAQADIGIVAAPLGVTAAQAVEEFLLGNYSLGIAPVCGGGHHHG